MLPSYLICNPNPEERLGGRFNIRHSEQGCLQVTFGTSYGNPPIAFGAGVGPNVLLAPIQIGKGAIPIDTQYYQDQAITTQEILITQDVTDPLCSTLGEPGNPENPVFATLNGVYFIHDPRFVSRNDSGIFDTIVLGCFCFLTVSHTCHRSSWRIL